MMRSLSSSVLSTSSRKTTSALMALVRSLALGGLLQMAAELVAQGRERLMREVGLAARREAIVEGRAEDVDRHAFVDRSRDHPAAFARVGDAAAVRGDVGILEQRVRGQVEQPRADHAAA